jgi:hypothetical protein
MRVLKPLMTVFSPNAFETSRISTTICPERSPCPTAKVTCPTRSRRAARSRRSCSSRPHTAFVARAPRFDAFAYPRFFLREQLVEACSGERFRVQHLFLAPLVLAEFSGIARERAAIELDDARCNFLEKTPVVRHEQNRARIGPHQLLQPFDGCDIEMIGRLVEQQRFRLARQCLCQGHSLAQSAGERTRRSVSQEAQAGRSEPRRAN